MRTFTMIIALVLALFPALSYAATAPVAFHTCHGDLKTTVGSGGFTAVPDTGESRAMVFEANGTYELTKIRLALFRTEATPDTAELTIKLWDTTGVPPVPDNTLWTSDPIAIESLPLQAGALSASFSSLWPYVEISGITIDENSVYAVSIESDSTDTDAGWSVIARLLNPNDLSQWLSDGNACADTGAVTVMGVWDDDIGTDLGFVLYGISTQETPTVTKFKQFLTVMLLGDTLGHAVAAGIIMVATFLGMVTLKAPIIAIASVLAIEGLLATLILLFDPWVAIAVILVVGVMLTLAIAANSKGETE